MNSSTASYMADIMYSDLFPCAPVKLIFHVADRKISSDAMSSTGFLKSSRRLNAWSTTVTPTYKYFNSSGSNILADRRRLRTAVSILPWFRDMSFASLSRSPTSKSIGLHSFHNWKRPRRRFNSSRTSAHAGAANTSARNPARGVELVMPYRPKLYPPVDLKGATPEALARALFRRTSPLPGAVGKPVVGNEVAVEEVPADQSGDGVAHLAKRV